MSYITRKQARFKTVTGKSVNLKPNLEVEEREMSNGIFLYYKDQPLCARYSQTANLLFAYNDDNQGKLRGKLLDAIMEKLENMKDPKHQEYWDKLWESTQAQAFRRKDFEDFWVWDESFYRAPVLMLQYIAGLIGA